MISKETIYKWFNNIQPEHIDKYIKEYGIDISKITSANMLAEELFNEILYIKEEVL